MSWPIRLVIALLAVLFLMLQYRLWVGEGSLAEVRALEHQLADQQARIEALRARNAALRAEVESLRKDADAIEARARRELGLIREDETYFQLIEPEAGAGHE
ncbi:cell division protein FtsB [endosymbiont of unidentified scaly snail isolate Monju]|uniref:cell division protein FtsB n=1 Tax=endosymbiont of unidentified scaly snail isolate Monju TaxID=1248727 RepID=UPI000389259B|nr:cell division protein FtsB [endosymbiont of unidentified scaly snail isolate Monju]BAN69230.1 cell division protein FtsB [endosymbiont of unidentified scaly snail isolate Monju]